MKQIQGNLTGQGHKYGIIIGRFNEFIGSKLKDGAIDCLVRHGVNEEEKRDENENGVMRLVSRKQPNLRHAYFWV